MNRSGHKSGFWTEVSHQPRFPTEDVSRLKLRCRILRYLIRRAVFDYARQQQTRTSTITVRNMGGPCYGGWGAPACDGLVAKCRRGDSGYAASLSLAATSSSIRKVLNALLSARCSLPGGKVSISSALFRIAWRASVIRSGNFV